MTNNLDINCSILKERFSCLISFIEKKLPNDLQVINSRAGTITARYKSILLHSSYNPAKEGEQFAQQSGINSGDYILLYGLGLGYHLKPVLDIIGPSGKLLVLELNREIISAAFALINFTEILSYPNFDIVSGNNDKEVSEKLHNIFKDWAKYYQEKCKTLIHQPSFKCIPDHFHKIQNTLEMQLIEKQTKAAWSGLEKNNYLENKEYIKNGKGINELAGKYKGKGALLLSGGPSLNRALPFLNKISSLFYLVSVDTSLPVLLRAHIKPHFIVSIDPQDLSFNHILDYLEENIPVILTPTANPKTVHHFSGEKYFVLQRKPYMDDIEKEDFIRTKGESKGGGSVSCIALDVMVQMGFDPIIFVGQDCSFPGNRLYAENAFEDQILINLLNEENTMEMVSHKKITEKKAVAIENKFGRMVPSHQHLYIYLRYIEQIVENYTNVTFYNWLSMGAKINGAKDIDSINEIQSEYG